MMIDVAIDARVTPPMSAGTRAYLRALLDGLPRVAPDVRLHPVGGRDNFGLDGQLRMPRAIARLAPELTHYPTIFAPLRRCAPYVATVHDLIHLTLPQFTSLATRAYYDLVAIPMLRGAACLVMGDGRTADECERVLGVPRERCRVVPLGYDPALLAPREPLATRRPFVFYAGNHRPHKNLRMLYEAWSSLPEPVELDLEVTGADDAQARTTYTRRNGELRFSGDLDDHGLAARYQSALAYVHPALAEGFGIPMLEAAAVGTPVIASASAIPSVVAPVAVAFPAHDGLALRALLADLAADPGRYRRRAAEGRATVRAYTWDRFAAATAAVYREVVDGAGR